MGILHETMEYIDMSFNEFLFFSAKLFRVSTVTEDVSMM